MAGLVCDFLEWDALTQTDERPAAFGGSPTQSEVGGSSGDVINSTSPRPAPRESLFDRRSPNRGTGLHGGGFQPGRLGFASSRAITGRRGRL
jgi:hypothetical protein